MVAGDAWANWPGPPGGGFDGAARRAEMTGVTGRPIRNGSSH